MAVVPGKQKLKATHMIPRNDILDHLPDSRCLCDPDMHMTSNGWLYIHFAYGQTEFDTNVQYERKEVKE